MGTTLETGTLAQSGETVLLTIPSGLLAELQLKAGALVRLSVDCGRLIVEPIAAPVARKAYSLQDLLAQCNPSAPLSSEETAWTGAKPAGRELV